MAAIIKFPLKMTDGAQVKTIEELREHFDLADILRYYDDGRLYKWLKAWYYDDEAEKVEQLDSCSGDFKENLCDILGVSCLEAGYSKVDLKDISKRNERLERLKQFTADDKILAAVDNVAFSQEELADLLGKLAGLPGEGGLLDGEKVVYLCGEHFIIPGSVGSMRYIGVGHPIVEFEGEITESDIDFQDVEFDFGSYINNGYDQFYNAFRGNSAFGVKLLHMAAEKKSATAQVLLGECYMKGFGVQKNKQEAVAWYQKAAEQGNADAQTNLGHCYRHGIGIQENAQEAVTWSRKAAEQGNANAQTRLGICYEHGIGVQKNAQEAVKWYQKAAEQGDIMSQYYLGCCYRDGLGVEKEEKEAIKWIQKSFDRGNKEAKKALLEIAPRHFKLSDVILHAVGGKENLNTGTNLNMETGEICISVVDRYKVNEAMLHKFGATDVRVEINYRTYPNTKTNEEEIMKAAGVGVLLGGLVGGLVGGVGGALFAETETEIVQEDLGEGCVHMSLEISPDMKDDFNNNVMNLIPNSSREKKKFWK